MLKTPKSFRDKFHQLAFYAAIFHNPRASSGRRPRYGFLPHNGKRECQRRRFQIQVGSLRKENGLAV